MHNSCLIINIMCNPEQVAELSEIEWDLLIRQARRSDTLAKLAFMLESRNLLKLVPDKAKACLHASQVLVKKHEQVVRWEVDRILSALKDVNIPVTLLKGAAYLMAELPAAKGRLFADVDIMVARDCLDIVEHALLLNGWITIKLDAYDQRYYRQWMQELPPLMHRRRQTVVDVHHRILPETTRAQPDAKKMLDDAIALNKSASLRTLSEVDMVLHSATHLFYEGEFDHGFRDLLDMRDLIGVFSEKPNFWSQLIERAQELQLQMPLYYALRYTHSMLQLPVPDIIWTSLEKPRYRRLMDALFKQALIPHHQSCEEKFTGLARWVLYLRSHYLRMPVYLLLPHLLRKAFTKKKQDK